MAQYGVRYSGWYMAFADFPAEHFIKFTFHQGWIFKPRRKFQMAEKSRGQLRFGRKFDGIDRSDSNFHLKKISAPLGFENNVFEKFLARAAGTKFVGEIYCGATLPVFSARNFKWPKNREDSSDSDKNLTESIAATHTFIFSARATGTKFVGEIYCGATLL